MTSGATYTAAVVLNNFSRERSWYSISNLAIRIYVERTHLSIQVVVALTIYTAKRFEGVNQF